MMLVLVISAILVLLGEVVMIMGVLFSLLSLYGNKLKLNNPKGAKLKVFLVVYLFAMIFS